MLKNLLITGGAGFIGSNFVEYFVKKYPNIRVINLDLLTYAGNLENLSKIDKDANYVFIKGDICDSALVKEIFAKYKIDSIINFAAESHVDNSILNPNAFIKTNINGTFNLLHNAYLAWFDAPHSPKSERKYHKFHHISTDEVFGSIEKGKFDENSPYTPNSPYAASKAASDMLVRSYHHTYGLNTLITNCSNNYGPKQHDEKLIPTIIRSALNLEEIPLYGDGKNVRDWLFVEDHCRAIDLVFFSEFFGEVFTIGGNCEKQNIEVIREICTRLDKITPRKDGKSYTTQIKFVKDRAGHDRRYAISSAKISQKLNWNQKESFKSGIEKTICWYLDKYKKILDLK